MSFDVSLLETEPIVLVRNKIIDPYLHDAFFQQHRFYHGDMSVVFRDIVNSSSYYEYFIEMNLRSLLLRGNMTLQDGHYNPNGKLLGLLDDLEKLNNPTIEPLKEFIERTIESYDTHDTKFYHNILRDIESKPLFLNVFQHNKINNSNLDI